MDLSKPEFSNTAVSQVKNSPSSRLHRDEERLPNLIGQRQLHSTHLACHHFRPPQHLRP